MSALSASKILIKGSSVPDKIPALSSLEPRELAVNTTDGKIFTKTIDNNIVTFLNSSEHPSVLNQSLSSTTPQYGSNTVSGVFGTVVNGFNNDISGSGSTVANGENNDIASDFSFIGSGLNNNISLTADYGAILGGSNNTLNHQQSFIIGSNITSHTENFTYVSNLSVLGKIYGDGSDLLGVTSGGGGGDESVNTLVRSASADWSIIGDRYFTTSITTNSINKGTKVFAVSANLSYIPTQDVTIVYDHDASRHMHGTILDYNSSTGSLTADVNSHTGSGTYSDWRINLGGTPTFVNSLVATNNLSDVSSPSTALANLSGVSKSELSSLSGSWQSTFTAVQSNSATWNIVPSTTNVQTFSSSNTWTKPTGAISVNIQLFAGGGGGGSGRRDITSGLVKGGGGGGGGGGYLNMNVAADQFSVTELVTIGAGGDGGVGSTGNAQSGSAGQKGGSTTFGTIICIGGNGGAGGTSSGGNGGLGILNANNGGNASATGSTGGGGNPLSISNATQFGGAGGAGGGGINAADVANPGAGGGRSNIVNLAGGSGGSVATAGGNGSNNTTNIFCVGSAGGGGGAGLAVSGGNGGNGGFPASGGGGGGASNTGTSSGAGGAGAAGFAIITTYF